jgi:glycosyltransferase involved in cell wall biosynthesis
LVNQSQILHLSRDPRLRLFHRDIPFLQPAWRSIPAGFDPEAAALIDAIPAPPPALVPDVIYRISHPLRIYPAPPSRVLIFGSAEWLCLRPVDVCGPSGTNADADGSGVEFVTPSAWSARGFMQSGVPADRIHVLPHGFEPKIFHPVAGSERRAFRSAFGISPDDFVFLSLGAMTWNKGIDALLAAFAICRRSDRTIRLLLKGADAMYGNKMAAAIAEANRLAPGAWDETAASAVTYIGKNLSQWEIAQLYQISDAYVAPYRAEGFGMPVLEALGSGLPVVATRGGATDDFCTDQFSVAIASQLTKRDDGRCFLEPSVESIVMGMRRVRDDDALRRAAATDGAAWAADNYSWSRVSHTLGNILCGSANRDVG